ncbi:hypothetical protein DFH09DRAFT_1141072 [Mycena vulgaris]|nr:hypothetical protein DFH09DRAFT_1141072 [Mycena vulgaris]
MGCSSTVLLPVRAERRRKDEGLRVGWCWARARTSVELRRRIVGSGCEEPAGVRSTGAPMHARALLRHAVLGRRVQCQVRRCIGSSAAAAAGWACGAWADVVSRRHGPMLWQQRLRVGSHLSRIRRPSVYNPRTCASIGVHFDDVLLPARGTRPQ